MPHDPRLANRDDLHAVEEIVQTAYTKYVSRIGREPAPMLDNYGALIEEGRVYVVEHDGAVKGILVVLPEEDAILLDNVAVAPGAQGRYQSSQAEAVRRTTASEHDDCRGEDATGALCQCGRGGRIVEHSRSQARL